MDLVAATFNTRHGRPDRGLARIDLLVRQCAAIDADILGLQELDRRVVRSYFVDQPRRVARALSMLHAWSPSRRPIVVGHEGNALLVRGTMSDLSILDLPDSVPHYGRTAIFAGIHVGTGADVIDISVATTHLHNDPEVAQRQLPFVLEHLGAMSRPRMLLGDLNMDRPLAEPILTDGGYVVANAGPTSPADHPREQIDFIAVDGIDVTTASVLPTIVSDHLPHTATLTMRGGISSR